MQGNQANDPIISYTAAPSSIRLFWKDSVGRILGSLGAVTSFVEASGTTLRFAMNAGMYTEDQQPLGLFIQEGKTVRRLNRDTGYGNFISGRMVSFSSPKAEPRAYALLLIFRLRSRFGGLPKAARCCWSMAVSILLSGKAR
jgi:hypothetical protein